MAAGEQESKLGSGRGPPVKQLSKQGSVLSHRQGQRAGQTSRRVFVVSHRAASDGDVGSGGSQRQFRAQCGWGSGLVQNSFRTHQV